MKINPRVFWMNVKSLRMNNEWSQTELASKIGLDPKNYSNKERGFATKVSRELADKIAEALGTTVEELATGEEPNEPLVNPEIANFWNNVRARRESLNISQKTMADMLGMSPTNWQTKESGKAIGLSNLLAEKVANALECTVDELKGETKADNSIATAPSIDHGRVIDIVTDKPVRNNSSAYDISHLPESVQRFISDRNNASLVTNLVVDYLMSKK